MALDRKCAIFIYILQAGKRSAFVAEWIQIKVPGLGVETGVGVEIETEELEYCQQMSITSKGEMRSD